MGNLQAHQILEEYVHHQLELRVGRRFVDVTVQLTFFGAESERERRVMDENGDGLVTRREQASYVKRMAESWASALALQWDGRPLELIPLYDSRMDLMSHNNVLAGHHELTLYYFVARPPQTTAPAEILLEDRLWPGVAAITEGRVTGSEGCLVRAQVDTELRSASAGTAPSRTFRALYEGEGETTHRLRSAVVTSPRVASPPTGPGAPQP